MAIAIDGSITVLKRAAGSESSSRLNGLHTTTANTSLLLCCWAIEGNENPHATLPCTFEASPLTLIADTGATGSNADVRILVHGMVSPGAVTDGDTINEWLFSASPICAVWANFSGTVSTSVAAATNDLGSDVNSSPSLTSTTVLASGGGTGNGLVAWAVAQSNAMAPSSPSGSFTEQVDDTTAATTSDFSFNLSTLLSGAPSACTITWNTVDENAGSLIELIPATSTSLLPDYSGTRGVMRGVGRGI